MISTLTSPSFVNRVQESWQAGYGVTQSSPVSGGPFTQAGFTLDMNFAAVPQQNLIWVTDQGLTVKTFNEIVTFTRASTGTYFDSAGVLQRATYNILPYSEQFDNAAWGKVGMTVTANAETAPDNTVTGDKLIPSVVTGLPYTQQTITVVSGANYAWSVYLKAAGYSWVFLDAFDGANHRTWFDLSTGTIGTVEAGNTATITDVGNGWYRCTIARSSGGVSTAYAVAIVSGNNALNITGNGVSGVFAWGAQLEQASAPGPYYATTTAANGAPRFDHNPSTLAPLGLLIEEQRTNSIRNSVGVGAVAPSTFPTNWQNLIVAGLTATVVGTGTQNGITYLDVRVNGTPSVSTYYNLVPDILVAGVSGQTWTGSFWLSLIAGSLTNTNANIEIREADSAQTFLANTLTLLPITSTLTRYSQVRTLNNPSTAFVSVRSVWQVTSGLPVDFTLRIGLPQLELGAFATSVIPTTTAAATRAADVAPVNTLSPWYNPVEGTLFAQGILVGGQASNFPYQVALVGSNPNNDSIGILWTANTGSMRFGVRVGGAAQADIPVGSSKTAGSSFKVAGRYAVNDFQAAGDGTVGTADTTGTLPAITALSLGGPVGFQIGASVWLQRITYYPRRLSNNELQAITT